jgi:hypothetical protein
VTENMGNEVKTAEINSSIMCLHVSRENIVTDLINALLDNSPVNTFQHTPHNNGGTSVFYAMTSRNNGGGCVFYVVLSPAIETVSSTGSVQSAYKRS